MSPQNNYFHRAGYITLILIMMLGLSKYATAQEVVKHSVSDVSAAAKHYSYTNIISETTKKEMKYFIVRGSNGVIKTAFDACDVCYREYRGYSQVDENMRCNNCGNQYAINEIGTKGSGGCWPGYLSHTIIDGEVVIKVSDIKSGEKYFKLETYSSVDDHNMIPLQDSFIFTVSNKELKLQMGIATERTFIVYDIAGNKLFSTSRSDSEISINLADKACGIYIITVAEGTKTYRHLFALNN